METSHENSTHVAVTDGLEEGMEVIVENNLNLAHESLVTVINEQWSVNSEKQTMSSELITDDW